MISDKTNNDFLMDIAHHHDALERLPWPERHKIIVMLAVHHCSDGTGVANSREVMSMFAASEESIQRIAPDATEVLTSKGYRKLAFVLKRLDFYKRAEKLDQYYPEEKHSEI
jgi:hypothetical protein